ncbi:MAG: CBS domain-containing protein [bacterium]|nr:CBS domain-containing protein [bacterium]
MAIAQTDSVQEQVKTYFLSELLGSGIFSTYDKEKRIGKLSDVTILEHGAIPHITELIISRPFGDPSLIIPVDRISEILSKKIIVSIESISQYESKPSPGAKLLADFVLDKKVIDVEGREISVVYDVRIIQVNGKLYVSDVEVSKYGLFRRLGLKLIADLFKIKEDIVSWTFIQTLPEQISSFKGDLKLTMMREKLADIPSVDMADIIEELNHEQRELVLKELDPEHASDTFEEVNPNVQREIVSTLDKHAIARMIDEMTPAQAADVLSVLSHAEKQNLFKILNPDLSEKIQSILGKQDENIMNYVTDRFVAFPPDYSVETVINEYSVAGQGKEIRHYVYAVDSENKLQGIVDIAELLTSARSAMLSEIMTENIVFLTPQNTLKEAYTAFIRYAFRGIPVINEEEKLMGIILYKDVMNLKHRFVS